MPVMSNYFPDPGRQPEHGFVQSNNRGASGVRQHRMALRGPGVRPSFVGSVIGLVGALILGGCSVIGDAGPALLMAGDDDGEFGVSQSDLPPGDTVSFGTVILCVKGGGSAVIESVRFKKASHLHIEHFAVRQLDFSKHDALGGSKKGIVAEGFTLASRTVSTACSAPGAVTELGMDFTADAGGVATGKTLVVRYHTAGHEPRTSEVPMTVVVCSATCPENLT
jgi:hypothetical protein